MEETPRANDNKNQLSESDKVEKKQNSAQEFISRWRIFSEKHLDTLKNKLENKTEEDEDNDEDEDELLDKDDTQLSRQVRRRYKRLRKKLKPFLPQSEKIDDSTTEKAYDSELKNVHNNTDTNSENKNTNVDSAESAGIDPIIIDRNEYQQDIVESQKSIDKNIADEAESIDKKSPVAETESLQQILQRSDFIESLQTNTSLREEQNNEGYKSQNHSPENIQHNNTGGLLAVDYLNYRAAKRRDNKNMKINKTEHKKIRTEQEEQFRFLQSQIVENKKQPEYSQKQYTEVKMDKDIPLTEYQNKTFYEREPVVRYDKPKAIQHEHELKTAPNQKSEQKMPAKSFEDNFEQTLKKVAKAENSKIKSEFEFERRHEVMDEPGSVKKLNGSVSGIPEFDPSRYNVTNKSSGTMHDPSKSKTTKNIKDESDVYKQAVATGFWAAVTGIVLFIIIYVLGSM